MKGFIAGLVAGAALAVLGFSIKDHGPGAEGSLGFVGSVDGKESRCSAKQLEHNRQLVRDFFKPERTPLDAYNNMTPDYVQHNEGVKRFGKLNGLSDHEAFKAIDEVLTKSAGRPELQPDAGRPRNEMAFKIIAACDHVVAVHKIYLPDPQNPASTYTTFDFELWRIADGKFAEHWDSQRIPVPIPDILRVPMSE